MDRGNNKLSAGCLVLLNVGVACGLAALVLAVGFSLVVSDLDFAHGPGVAVLNIRDELVDEQYVLDQLAELVDHPATKALVVRIDSPGGEITVVEEIFNGLKRVREEEDLPVVASMGAVAASGGYYVCCAAQWVFTNKSSLTGSLGVVIEYPNAEGLFGKLGIAFDTVKSGEFKGAGSLSRPLTERQREHMQQVIDDYHEMFVELVSAERHIEPEDVRALADGRVFTGRQALELGLVDEIGDLDDAVHHAAGLAGIEGEPRVIRLDEPRLSFFTLLDEFRAGAVRLGRPRWAPQYMLR